MTPNTLALLGATLAGTLISLAPSVTAQTVTGKPGSPGTTTTIDGRYLPPPPQRFRGDVSLNAAQ